MFAGILVLMLMLSFMSFLIFLGLCVVFLKDDAKPKTIKILLSGLITSIAFLLFSLVFLSELK